MYFTTAYQHLVLISRGEKTEAQDRTGSSPNCLKFDHYFLYTIEVSKIYINPKQIQEWVDAAEGIAEDFGIEKALGYLIGEKFYNLVSLLHDARKSVRNIDEKRKQPDFNPTVVTKYKDSEFTTNFDEIYDRDMERIQEAERLLPEFAGLIIADFDPHEIRKYFESHPRLGVHGHATSEEQFDFMVQHGAIEHSIDTEVEDALIFGDMMKYFGING